jgi:hypothetical protein
MAIHLNANSLTAEVIEEYLDIAKLCIATKKQDGGIYGYPATLLLFCVIEALGRSLTAGKEPFRVLNGTPFNCRLNNTQVKQLKQWYRNPLAHNGMIAPGVCLSPEERGDAFRFAADEPVLIRVKSLYDLVRAAWEQVDRTTLHNIERLCTNPEIRNPLLVSGATASMPVTASGSLYEPPQRVKSRAKKA